jgi:hypothetical protein
MDPLGVGADGSVLIGQIVCIEKTRALLEVDKTRAAIHRGVLTHEAGKDNAIRSRR